MGGLMVGALMDVAWVEGHINEPAAALAKLQRARQSLRAAVDMKRNLIERLRPSLLENIGLFAALKWHIEKLAAVGGIPCSFQLSADEPLLPPESAITLFRIVQEAVRLMMSRLNATSIELAGRVEGARLLLLLSYGSAGVTPFATDAAPEFATLLHQITTLRGTLELIPRDAGGASWEIAIPTKASDLAEPQP
jgi:signal transduction histidine kinase